ncbi:ATP-binding cassette domain-containing protein [Odoribacter sp. OttesenSCG-928-J03]|nr:ATP-binding cassette domain-containing protein [Odoribacter sp. OttesenSCG-928-J03]MDL2283217.1 ATP-binding cassette domain-containing protein [Odoribacter sp. OttesenSCG-928-G04]
MNKIYLNKVVPEVFKQQDNITSEVWQQDMVLVKGELCLLEAVSGAGKSSLCSYLYGYRSDYSGEIIFDTDNIRKYSFSRWGELRRNSLSILFQELRLFPELTVLENILLKNNLTGFKDTTWISNCLDMLGIPEKRDVLAGQLSFGQQQRVALVRSLCQPFDFIMLDEPVSHLDEANNTLAGELLQREVRSQGAGMLVTSIGKHPRITYDKIIRL